MPRVIVFVSLYDAVSRTPIDVHFSHFPEKKIKKEKQQKNHFLTFNIQGKKTW